LVSLGKSQENARYASETLPGAEQADRDIEDIVRSLKGKISGWSGLSESERDKISKDIEIEAKKLEQLFKRREALIKELRSI